MFKIKNYSSDGKLDNTYSRLSRRSSARVSSTNLVTVGPTKVKAHKSVLYTAGTPKVEKSMR